MMTTGTYGENFAGMKKQECVVKTCMAGGESEGNRGQTTWGSDGSGAAVGSDVSVVSGWLMLRCA